MQVLFDIRGKLAVCYGMPLFFVKITSFIYFSEGMLDATIPLKLIIYMAKEDHFVPMEMLRQKSKCLEPFFKKAGMKRLYKQYVWYLQEHLLDKLGMEDKGGILEQ